MTEDGTLPAALVDQHTRLADARAASRRFVARALARRRLLPPLVVGSGAVLGSSAVGAWVLDQQRHVPAPVASSPSAGPTSSSAGDAQLSADVAALGRLSQTLAADRTAIASLEAAGSARAVNGAGTAAAAGPGAAVGSGASSGSGPGATASVPAAIPAPSPALPALPTLPAVAVPPPAPAPQVHTTTGATAVVH